MKPQLGQPADLIVPFCLFLCVFLRASTSDSDTDLLSLLLYNALFFLS